jgi:hypothetical protein
LKPLKLNFSETLVEEVPEVFCPELADAVKPLLPLPERMIIDFSMKLSFCREVKSGQRPTGVLL